jgi:hypothetical protein
MVNLEDQIKNLSPAKRALLEQKLAARNSAGPAIPRRSATDPRVLSPAQHQLWFLDQLSPGITAYNVPHFVRLHGKVNSNALKSALDGVVGRHEVLRTMYLPYKGKVIPAIAKQWSVELREETIAADVKDRQLVLERLLHAEAARPFDLARDLKLRGLLVHVSDQESVFLHVSHHIAWDLHSRKVLYRELEGLYSAFLFGRKSELRALPLQYMDYAAWHRNQLQGEQLAELQTYWREKLSGAPPFLTIPTDFERPKLQDLDGIRLPLRLTEDILNLAKDVARDNRATLYMVLLAIFCVFLSCYSNQDDVSIGSPFDGRGNPETEPLIGMFINTLVLRLRIQPEMTFEQLIAQSREVVLGAISHQDLSFEQIVDAVQPPRDQSRMPLFQANFRLQGMGSPELHLAGLESGPSTLIDNHTSKFDLALELPSVPESAGYLEYSTSLFKPETADKMAEDVKMLLRALLLKGGEPINKITEVVAVRTGVRSRLNGG